MRLIFDDRHRQIQSSHVILLLRRRPPPPPATVSTPRYLPIQCPRPRQTLPLAPSLPPRPHLPPPLPPDCRAEIRHEPDEIPHRGPCGRFPARATCLYACLACAVVSCPAHATVDVDHAELFCCVCRDQVYDRNFNVVIVLDHTSSSTLTRLPLLPKNLRKWWRGDYRPLVPDLRELEVITRGSRLLLARNDNRDPNTSSFSSTS